jgi:hypothetical protein
LHRQGNARVFKTGKHVLMMKHAANSSAWAIGSQRRNGFHVRRIVWGLLMAQCECRDGEQVRAATLMV